jgi:hypothetical protein
VPAALEHAVEDDLGKILVVEHGATGRERLVRREQHRPLLEVSVVDDVEEHVGGVVRVREAADLVDDENVGARVVEQAFPEASLVRSDRREVVDERGARRE